MAGTRQMPDTKSHPAPLPKEVEEAMDKVAGILSGWSFHSGFPSEEGLAALAVIRAALSQSTPVCRAKDDIPCGKEDKP